MIRSMTGYARVERQGPWGQVTWELRSVNHRYLDLQFRIPEEFRTLESELRQQAAARLARGKVEAQLRYTTNVDSGAIDIDRERLQQLLAAVQIAGTMSGDANSPDPLRLLAWPGVVRERPADFAPLLANAADLFGDAINDFTATREREGAQTQQHLLDRCSALQALTAQVRARMPEVRGAALDKLRERCRELGVEVDPGRLEQELALIAQRLDVDEEMSRLGTHVDEVRRTLGRDDAIGRRLDFLMQELNREANTLSSKSQDAEMTRCAVEMKVLIEQMREQVQNVE